MPDMSNYNSVDGMQYGEAPEIPRDPPPKLDNLPDISSELDVLKLRSGSQFYARFVMDPQGDSVRWAKDHIEKLRSGAMSRQNIGVNYWINGTYLERPPVAQYLGRGKFKIIEA